VTVSEKLLVVGPSWVGDMVMAQSLYKLLKAGKESVSIDVLAPAWSLPLLERMPEVSRGIELPLGHGELGLGRRRQLGRSLRGQYDRAIVLPRSLKSALVPWFAGIRRRTGFRGEWRYGLINDMRPFDAKRLDKTVLRFVALGMQPEEKELPEPPEPALRANAEAAERLLARTDKRVALPFVALMPGAEYGPAKQWPTASYARLAARLAEKGVDVVILGSSKEAPLGQEIASQSGSPRVLNFCGETALVDAVDLLAAASVAVSNDSGLMHIAAAVGTATVAIYGSSTPDFTPPLTANADIHYRRLSCSPCFARECPLGHLDCLNGITVDAVFESVRSRLADRASASRATHD
jgi:heptosyltransferase-2